MSTRIQKVLAVAIPVSLLALHNSGATSEESSTIRLLSAETCEPILVEDGAFCIINMSPNPITVGLYLERLDLKTEGGNPLFDLYALTLLLTGEEQAKGAILRSNQTAYLTVVTDETKDESGIVKYPETVVRAPVVAGETWAVVWDANDPPAAPCEGPCYRLRKI